MPIGIDKSYRNCCIDILGGSADVILTNPNLLIMTNDETMIVGSDYKPEFHEKRKSFPSIIRQRRGQNKALVTKICV